MQAVQPPDQSIKRERESIHSGQFMVSTFEAEEQDDEDEVAVPIPEVSDTNTTLVPVQQQGRVHNNAMRTNPQQLAIDTSLSKLFQCMSLAYRQKLTSPKWNRFRGIRLRWKDKIRLNNVIWRCWHLQFIKKENTLICQFASPLDVDTHNKPEAVVLEGKYWKRKLAAVTAEYKKWRMFYRNHASGLSIKDDVEMLSDVDLLTSWSSQSAENMHMMVDEDYMGLMSDTLFSTITNQPFVFPDSREIAKAGLAEFIQPSLGPLQPNLDDYMDTFEPLQEFMQCKLPTVPEEQIQNTAWNVQEYYINSLPNATNVVDQYQTNMSLAQIPMAKPDSQEQNLYNTLIHEQSQPTVPSTSYHSVISKNNKCHKNLEQNHVKLNQHQIQQNMGMRNVYPNYVDQNICVNEPVVQQESAQIPQQAMVNQYKMQEPQSTGYKFTAPSAPNLKFTSQVSKHMMQPIHSTHSHYNTTQSFSQKEDKLERRVATRGRPRSRSNPREPPRRPPLLSAISDPSLLTPSNSVLLTQLLTNNTDNEMYNQRKQGRVKEESNTPVAILPQPPPPTTTLVITGPLNMNPTTSNSTDPLMLNSFSNSNSPIFDNSQNIHSPTSSQGSIGSPNRDTPHKDSRRVGHIHAEQKRRYNIKNGFDMIHTLIPHLNQNPNAKLSKAAMLQKGAEYIRQLRSERNQLNEEMECLRQQIETLNTSISNCQSMLPATGAPVSRRRDTKMQEMFDDYIKERTMENWKYWIFSLLFRPLLESFNSFVSTSSLDDLYRSTILWVEQHCTLVDLRPVVINSLKYLSTKTDILSKPEKLPEEAREMVLSNQN